MQSLLKPGGEFIFWEHCRNSDPVTRAVQCEYFPCRLSSVRRKDEWLTVGAASPQGSGPSFGRP